MVQITVVQLSQGKSLTIHLTIVPMDHLILQVILTKIWNFSFHWSWDITDKEWCDLSYPFYFFCESECVTWHTIQRILHTIVIDEYTSFRLIKILYLIYIGRRYSWFVVWDWTWINLCPSKASLPSKWVKENLSRYMKI